MTLLAEAQAAQGRIGGQCSVASLLERLDPTEQAELLEALNADVQAKALSRAMKDRGWDIAAQTIQRHRRGDCKCH